MKPRSISARRDRRPRKLLDEALFLTILLSAIIIIVIETVSLALISGSMRADLRNRALVTARETVVLLEDPLFQLDDSQAIRIGEALLSSGRISGIELESTVTGKLMRRVSAVEASDIPSVQLGIIRKGRHVGSVHLYFSDREVIATRSNFAAITIIVVAAVILASFLGSRYIIRSRVMGPLDAIAVGIENIANGNYDKPIQETIYQDVNTLVSLINEMAAKVLAKNSELKTANDLLEGRVAERTEELEKSLNYLRQAHERLVESEKLSALGRLSASMAHELNTPLAAIISSIDPIIRFLERGLPHSRRILESFDEAQVKLFDKVLALGMEVSTKPETWNVDRKQSRQILAHLEAAGVPNGPEMAVHIVELGIGDRLPELDGLLLGERSAEILATASEPVTSRRMAEVIATAAGKAADVVRSLRSWLGQSPPIEARPVDIVKDIEIVLTLMNGSMKGGVRIERDFSKAWVLGSSEQLSQVWMNLVRNAAQAMGFEGEILLRTECVDDKVIVTIVDSGPGIPGTIRSQIFDPFFTTKVDGEGMGLGLDICKRIIEAHSGSIALDSRPGRTEFRVTLPAYEG